jgi:hypothetical protein
LEGAAPGLDLICPGLRQIRLDDHVALERGALIYKVLYAQLKRSSSSLKHGSEGEQGHTRFG